MAATRRRDGLQAVRTRLAEQAGETYGKGRFSKLDRKISKLRPRLHALPPPPADPPVAASSGGDADARARAIAAAPVVAKITEWVDDPQIGSFATLDVLVPPSVRSGTVLCVRRNSGILGRLKVGDVSSEGAIANAVSQFGGVKPAAGDELILEPAGP